MRNTIPGLPAHTCAVPCRTVLSPHHRRKPSDHHTRFRSLSRALPLPFLSVVVHNGLPYIRFVHFFPMLWHYRSFFIHKNRGKRMKWITIVFLHAIPLSFIILPSWSSLYTRSSIYIFLRATNSVFNFLDVLLFFLTLRFYT